MNILILVKDLQLLRQLQTIVEETVPSSSLFLEWETAKASDVLRRQDIDVLICEAGSTREEYVDFLMKTFQKKNWLERIVLLNHAEESFLERLEDLPGALFLKAPLEREKVEKMFKLVWERVEQRNYTRQLEQNNHHWESHKRLIQQQFWMRFLSGQTSLDPSDFLKEAEDSGIEMKLSDTYQIGVLSRKLIRVRNTEIEKQTRKPLLEFANQWFRKQGADFIILDQLRPLLIIRNMPKEEFLYQCKGLIREISREKEIPLCIYYDADIFCENIFSSVLSIMAAEKEDLEEESGVYPAAQSMIRKKEEIDVLIPAHTEEFLRNGHYELVLQNIRAFLQEQSEKGVVSGSYLKAMRLDFSQILYGVLKEKRILAHKVMMEPGLKEKEVNAHISIESFLGWVEAVLACMPEKKTASVAEAVQNYVKEHVGEEVTREMVAEALYMNVDYLGRLYKRETGQSLGNYIVEEKMKEACRLLTSTRNSVGEISTELGYDNFSHFSKLFKKITGCTPREYRNLYDTEKKEKN